MRNSWKLLTTVGAGLLVVAGPSVTVAAAADVPSPQSGVSQPNPDGPPNAYNPGAQADGGQASKDSAGGPQTGKEVHPSAPKPATMTAPNGQQVTTPDVESGPSNSNPPAASALPPQRAGKQAPTGGQADPSFPADPKMPSAGDDGSDLNMPNVTAPGEGPGPVGPTS